MRRFYNALPGPSWVRILIMLVLAAGLLFALVVLFEYGGDLLDTGGVVGGS